MPLIERIANHQVTRSATLKLLRQCRFHRGDQALVLVTLTSPALTLVVTSTVAGEPKVTLSPLAKELEMLVAPRLTQLVVVCSSCC